MTQVLAGRDHRCGSSRPAGMAKQTFQAVQHDRLLHATSEELPQGFNFRVVANRSRGAMSLDRVYGSGVDAVVLIAALQRQ